MKAFHRLQGMQAFYALLGGQLISVIGSGMTRFGLSVWVLAETGDTTTYTTMIFFAVFPAGLGALFTGPFIDRWDRRKLFIGANLIASLSILAMAILFFTDSMMLWRIYLVMAINGIASAFISPAMQSSAAPACAKREIEPRFRTESIASPYGNNPCAKPGRVYRKRFWLGGCVHR